MPSTKQNDTKHFTKKIMLTIGLVVTAAIMWLLLWPVPFEVEAWYPAPPPDNPIYAKNGNLTKAKIITTGNGPEAIAVDKNGNIFTGLANGDIMKYTPDGTPTKIINTKGRPLGLKLDKNNNIVIADAKRGLLVYYTTENQLITLADQVEKTPIKFADDLDIAQDGTVWFSDASQLFGYGENQNEVFSQKPSGRLIAYTPKNGEVKIALDELAFANGVALAKDESFILINETYRNRVRRLWLTGQRAGTSDMFAENLPGYPDNITRAPDGGFWVALVAPRNPAFDWLASNLFARKIVYRLTSIGFRIGTPDEKAVARAIKLDQNGNTTKSLDDATGKINTMTSVIEQNKKLYLGQLNRKGIGILSLKSTEK